jgi:hypothetical protein
MELVLLSLDRDWFLTTTKKAESGDQAALEEMRHLWDDYATTDIECFICTQPVERPVFMMVLPELNSATTLIGAPLCHRCRDLPNTLRWSRCLRILKRMGHTKGKGGAKGKAVHFVFRHARTSHPR